MKHNSLLNFPGRFFCPMSRLLLCPLFLFLLLVCACQQTVSTKSPPIESVSEQVNFILKAAELSRWSINKSQIIQAIDLAPNIEAKIAGTASSGKTQAALGALLSYKEGAKSHAAELLQKAISTDPENTEAMQILAHQFAFRTTPPKFAEAIGLYQSILAVRPHDVEAHFRLAEISLAQDKFPQANDRALRAIKWAQALNDVHAVQETRKLYGKIQLAQGKTAQAKDIFQKSVLRRNRFQYHTSDGTHWGCAYQGLGELYSQIEAPTKMSSAVYSAPGFSDQNAQSMMKRSLDFFAKGQHKRAADAIDRALALDAEQVRYQVIKGFLLLLSQQYEKAENLFLPIHNKNPGAPGTFAGMGHLDIIRKNYARARPRLEQALDALQGSEVENDPYRDWLQTMTLLGLGWASSNQNLHERGLEYYDQILQHHPDDLLALLGKGNALVGLHRLDEGEKQYQRVLSIQPENRFALAELAGIQFNRGEIDQAEQTYLLAIKQDAKSFTCPYEGLGLVYLKQGKTQKARESLEKAIAINPDIEFKKFNALAKIHIAKGNLEKAKALLTKSIENFPYDNEAASLLLSIHATNTAPALPDDLPDLSAADSTHTTVPLGLSFPLDLLMPKSEAADFSFGDHAVTTAGQKVFLDDEIVALDLSNASAQQAAGLIQSHPQAAQSLRAQPNLLCDSSVISALKTAQITRLALSIPDAVSNRGALHCLSALAGVDLFLRFEKANDDSFASLSSLENLVELKAEGTRITGAGLSHLSKSPRLRLLFVAQSPVTDDGLKHIAKFRRLEKLNLWGTAISEAGLAHLSGLTALRELELGNTDIRDAGLTHLSKMRQLRVLGLAMTQITGVGFASLIGLPALEQLSLWDTPVSDAGLAHLSHLKSITSLELFYTNVTDLGMRSISQLPNLRSLDLGATRITDAGLAFLSDLQHIESLALWNTPISDSGLEHLSQMTSLQELNLGRTNIGDRGVSHLSNLTELTNLGLWATGITDKGMAHLSKMTQMQELEIFDTNISDKGIALLSQMKQMRYLSLEGTNLTDAGLKPLSQLTGLQELELVNTHITDQGLAYLTPLHALTQLGLGGTNISDNGLIHLADLQNLQELGLGCTRVTGQGLRHLYALPALTQLGLSGTKVDDSAMVDLQKFTGLQKLELGGTQISDAGMASVGNMQGLIDLELWYTKITDSGVLQLSRLDRLRELELAGTKISDGVIDQLAGLFALQVLEIGATRVSAAKIERLKTTRPSLDVIELADF